MIPKKLQSGDEVMVIAPSESFLSKFNDEMRLNAKKRLEEPGLKVTFGKYVEEIYESKSATVEHRLEDLYNAFSNPDIKAVIPVAGGTTSNELLEHIDYDLIRKNPKIICGLSDNTALLNSIYKKTGIVTYYGPHFSVFGASDAGDYTMDYFSRCFFSEKPILLKPSNVFFKSEWEKEEFENDGFWAVNEGEAHEQAIGGNLLTLNFLQGSEFMPLLEEKILLIEDNGMESTEAFFNQLQAMINQPGFDKVRGIVIGRFQTGTGMSKELLKKVLNYKMELDEIPIVANVDFGHTLPMVTFPIGGKINLLVEDNNVKIEITVH
jgi:muramoyltetrapeptide carboxypeptidase